MTSKTHSAPVSAPEARIAQLERERGELLLALQAVTVGDFPAFRHPDDAAVDRFAAAMKAKMAENRAKGRSGWDNEALCSAKCLQDMLVDHIAKGDPVDVGNFAMMLFNRGDRTTAANAPRLSKATDLSHRLRETADQQPGWRPLLTAAADEIERYYGGMLAWKQTAEKKDRDWNDERMGRMNDRIAARHTATSAVVQALKGEIPLVEPVHIGKALRAGRQARVCLSGGTGPLACVMLVNIQLSPWIYDEDTAKAFADGYNRALDHLRGAVLEVVEHDRPTAKGAGGQS